MSPPQIERIGIRADETLGKIERLREEEPMPVAHGERHVGALEMLGRREDVENRQSGDRVGMIERHPIGAAAAAIVPDDGEAIEAEIAA